MDPDKTSTHPLATISLVMGILTFIMFLGPIGAIPAIVCGHLALFEIKKSEDTHAGKGVALAGTILGYLGLVVTIVVIGLLVSLGISARGTLQEIADNADRLNARNRVSLKPEGMSADDVELFGDENEISLIPREVSYSLRRTVYLNRAMKKSAQESTIVNIQVCRDPRYKKDFIFPKYFSQNNCVSIESVKDEEGREIQVKGVDASFYRHLFPGVKPRKEIGTISICLSPPAKDSKKISLSGTLRLARIDKDKRLKIILCEDSVGKPFDFIGKSKLILQSYSKRSVSFDIIPKEFASSVSCYFRAQFFDDQGEAINHCGSGTSSNTYEYDFRNLPENSYVILTYPVKSTPLKYKFNIKDIELP